YTGDIERDETWFPLTQSQVAALSPWVRMVRFRLLPLAVPLYLLRRTPARACASHFDPRSPLVPAGARGQAVVSVALCGLMVLLLVGGGWVSGPVSIRHHYAARYVVFASCLGLAPYLHHTDGELRWSRGRGGSFLWGALPTRARHYGPFEPIHHDAG